MAYINVVSLSGNLTRDAELASMPDGTPVANFSIAATERRQVDGEWQEKASFWDCSLYGQLAQALHSKLVKGTKCVVSGKLVQRRWEKDGQQQTRYSISVAGIEVMTPPPPAAKAMYDEDVEF